MFKKLIVAEKIMERKISIGSNPHLERNYEFQTDIHILFIDFKQEYDKILWTLRKLEMLR